MRPSNPVGLSPDERLERLLDTHEASVVAVTAMIATRYLLIQVTDKLVVMHRLIHAEDARFH